jgi:hypothetical protein
LPVAWGEHSVLRPLACFCFFRTAVKMGRSLTGGPIRISRCLHVPAEPGFRRWGERYLHPKIGKNVQVRGLRCKHIAHLSLQLNSRNSPAQARALQ